MFQVWFYNVDLWVRFEINLGPGEVLTATRVARIGRMLHDKGHKVKIIEEEK